VWSVIDYENIDAMFRHWQQEPPVDVLAAAWMQYKPPSNVSRDAPRGPLKLIADRPPSGLQSMRAKFPGGAIRVG
jgi:hypothetical protein